MGVELAGLGNDGLAITCIHSLIMFMGTRYEMRNKMKDKMKDKMKESEREEREDTEGRGEGRR